MKRCERCKTFKPLNEYVKNKGNADGLHGRCKACTRAYYLLNRERIIKKSNENQKKNKMQRRIYTRQYARDSRISVIEHLGGKCIRCGFSDIRALQVDHVNGGGRKELKIINYRAYHKKIISDKTNSYQLLCANCNQIKKIENGEHGGYDGRYKSLKDF